MTKTDWLGGNTKDFGPRGWGSNPLTDTMALLTRIHAGATWSLVEVEQKNVRRRYTYRLPNDR